jgi:hypothetical protein
MRSAQPRQTLHMVGFVPQTFGYWPHAGFSGIAYRLANFRLSRLALVLGASLLFYIA